MDADHRGARELLDRIEPVPTGPQPLSPEYLEAVRRIEDHPDNQSGSEKSWVGEALRWSRAHFAGARLR